MVYFCLITKTKREHKWRKIYKKLSYIWLFSLQNYHILNKTEKGYTSGVFDKRSSELWAVATAHSFLKKYWKNEHF